MTEHKSVDDYLSNLIPTHVMEEYQIDMLPPHMTDAVIRYLMLGLMPGSFLEAVLANDLTQAFYCADDINKHRIADWCYWLMNHCPHEAWGNREVIHDWNSRGGLVGRSKDQNSEKKFR